MLEERIKSLTRKYNKTLKDNQQSHIEKISMLTDMHILVGQLSYTSNKLKEVYAEVVRLMGRVGKPSEEYLKKDILNTFQLEIDTVIATINRIHYLTLTKRDGIFECKEEPDEETARENTIEEIFRLFKDLNIVD